jgi:hypothetical protein
MLQASLLPRWLVVLVAALVGLALLLVILWYALFRPQIRSTAQNEVNSQLTAKGVTPVSTAGDSRSGAPVTSAGGPNGGGSTGAPSGASGQAAGGSSPGATRSGIDTASSRADRTINRAQQASGNGKFVVFNIPKGQSLQITDLLVENSAGAAGNLTLARSGTPVMQWAMANFRDLDYHWITPTVFGPETQVQMIVSGCTGPCTPAIYYAGHLVAG